MASQDRQRFRAGVIVGAGAGLLVGMGLVALITLADPIPQLASDVHPLSRAYEPAEREMGAAPSVQEGARVAVAGPAEAELDAMRAEVDRLRAELLRRDGLTVTALARTRPGKHETDVQRMLDRSSLLPDAQALAIAGAAMTPDEVWRALDAEDLLHTTIRSLLDTMPPMSSPHAERRAWHDTVVRPRMLSALADTCNQLHDLRLPSSLIERFRKRIEGD